MINIDIFKESAKSPRHERDKGWCEDSIFQNRGDEGNIICLSDGCGSGEQPELGAALLAKLGSTWLSQHHFDSVFKFYLTSLYDSLGITNYNDMLATLNHLHIVDNKATVTIVGDGCWFYQTKSGTLHLHSIEFIGNAPHFIQYEMTNTDTDSMGFGLSYIDSFEEPRILPQQREWLDQATSKRFTFEYNVDDLQLIGIASDGLTSFINMDNTEAPLTAKQILERILNIKHPYGDFMKRACKKTIQELWEEGLYHYDDLSIGVALLN